MSQKKEKYRVANFLNLHKDMRSFFKTILDLDSEGEFQELLEAGVVREKVDVANARWTGENLILEKC